MVSGLEGFHCIRRIIIMHISELILCLLTLFLRCLKVGENGTGKSTLVKLLTGELSPQEGYRQAHRLL